jgi:polar amino acid transport system ATP-binding protein
VTAPNGTAGATARPAHGDPLPLVRIRGLRKSFGLHRVLDGIDLDVREGEVTVLLGPSGSGKSTLLRCVNHLEKPDAGFVEVAGELVGYRFEGGRLRELPHRQVTRQRARIGMVFQQFNLFGHMTVLENIVEGPVAAGVPRKQAVVTAGELLERVGLAGREGSYPRQMSGGQQQRVAIARALALQPRLMLFDEPTSALDPELVGEVLSVIKDLAASGMTMIVVTHEIGFAREVADTVVFLDGGRVVESGPPASVLTSPRHQRARAFLAAVL